MVEITGIDGRMDVVKAESIRGISFAPPSGGECWVRTEGGLIPVDADEAKKVSPNGDFSLSVSSKGKEIAEAHAKALEIAKNTPDIREDKVEEFKRRIASGEYEVDSAQVADGMLREAIRDELAKLGVVIEDTAQGARWSIN